MAFMPAPSNLSLGALFSCESWLSLGRLVPTWARELQFGEQDLGSAILTDILTRLRRFAVEKSDLTIFSRRKYLIVLVCDAQIRSKSAVVKT